MEPIRLVIWDLDETFWKGTLTEGGIEYIQENHDLVIDLAKRGIVSSICSKNDYETVKKVLEEKGIWEYFIFPSINWDPKGPRIARMIEAVQLRAPTVAFIDDNPMNLNEVKHFVPDVQVYAETFIPEMRGHGLLKGKDDSALSRLNQYKLLETRKKDEQDAGGDNIAFLRSSGIKVVIDYDIEANIDRAVELINRTNQLNFTKRRLSEDVAVAREQLRAMIAQTKFTVGLVRVFDRYGDYGYCGFYAVKGLFDKRLMHFCFSCRILNMGVETWLYNKLGRPDLKVVGEVLLDVVNDPTEVDWITQVEAGDDGSSDAADGAKVETLYIRGGCDLGAMSHYVGNLAQSVITEFPTARNGAAVRIDHSQFLKYALTGVSPSSSSLSTLGYEDADFETALPELAGKDSVVSVFSFWMDAYLRLQTDAGRGLAIPALFTKADARPAEAGAGTPFVEAGRISEADFKDNLRLILSKARSHRSVFILLANEYVIDPATGERKYSGNYSDLNAWTRAVAREYPNVELIDVRDFIERESEVHGILHFDRMVYFRIMKFIRENVSTALQAA